MNKLFCIIPIIIIFIILFSLFLKKEKYSISASQYPGTVTNMGTLTSPSLSPLNVMLSDSTGNISTALLTDIGNPPGVIVMWSGQANEIPTGWALCDGTSYGSFTAPDLRSKFIVGASLPNTTSSTNSVFFVGDVGGEEAHQLTLEETPSHSHYFFGNNSGNYQPNGSQEQAYIGSSRHISGTSGWGSDPPNSPRTGATAYTQISITGGNPANNFAADFHNNMPPFYALAYIIKLPY